MQRVEGHKDLYRGESGAIVNTDSIGYNNYINLRKRRKSEKEEIDRLKDEIDEIKSLLKEITNK
tara:strand:+ start:734 stop:925 length:192 start_codon:yes stop_codon:yes gene_type:complete